jgi:hypothetical protein
MEHHTMWLTFVTEIYICEHLFVVILTEAKGEGLCNNLKITCALILWINDLEGLIWK